MAGFAIHFFICNIFISIIIGIILYARKIFIKNYSARLQYNLWFILLVLFAAPFIKLKTTGLLGIWEKINYTKNSNTSIPVMLCTLFNLYYYTNYIFSFNFFNSCFICFRNNIMWPVLCFHIGFCNILSHYSHTEKLYPTYKNNNTYCRCPACNWVI